jgi:hypothetical protein
MTLNRRLLLSVCLFAAWASARPAFAGLGEPARVVFAAEPGAVPLVAGLASAPVLVDAADWPGVVRAARDFQLDVERVSGVRPDLLHGVTGPRRVAIIIGTLGKSALVDRLVRSGRLDAAAIRGKWEAWVTEVVRRPLPGIDVALVVAGSDKRGTIYGTYDLSEQVGVSPWYWWADVPSARHDELYVRRGRVVQESPAVKYRGIFLNDEAPALSGWAKEKFGGFNSRFYAHVFELVLRLRGNYLWPAMWGSAFNEDDPDNARLADEYGVVMGTSHHEPMLRAQAEWTRHGKGPWNYEINAETLSGFWSEGVRRNRAFESIVSIGMRGDGDMAMSESANVALLERIVRDQRAILAREMDRPVERIPQLWALYKEVQEYYEKGMRVPDDVTLLWADDNHGNIRRLPTAEERKRAGGAGVYYHFDYVGGPRSYKWLNVTPVSKAWEQMHLAWQYGADRIWIVNVGDLKPMEFPTEFFLRYAWSPKAWPYERLTEFGRLWAAREFGEAHAREVADLVAGYTKLNASINPEWLGPDVFSVVNYDEAARHVSAWKALDDAAARVSAQLPAERRDAFFQLVLWPIRACAIVNEMHVAAGLNRLYASQARTATNTTADRVRELFRADEALTRQYNELGRGRWRHFADQTHIGYTMWQQPLRNVMPAVAEIQVPAGGEIAVAVEGSRTAWPENVGGRAPAVPVIDSLSNQSRWIEVFDRGLGPVDFTVEPSESWLRVSERGGRITGAEARRIAVQVDWSAAPEGRSQPSVCLKDQGDTRVCVRVPVLKHPASVVPEPGSFLESNGVIAIEAVHYARAVTETGIEWRTLEGFGPTEGGVTAFPVTAEPRTLSPTSPRLEYQLHTVSSGKAAIELTLAPTLAFVPGRGLRLAVSVDEETPQVVDLRVPVGDGQKEWERSVTEGVRKVTTTHQVERPGTHRVKVWMVDPAVVLERVVVSFGEVRPSYFGPPESVRR